MHSVWRTLQKQYQDSPAGEKMKTLVLLLLIARAAAQWTSPPTKACQALMDIRESVFTFNCTVNDQCDTLHCISTTIPGLTVASMLLPCNSPPAVRLSFNGSLIFDDVISKSKNIKLETLGGTLSVRLDYLPKDVIGIRIGFEVTGTTTILLEYTRIPLDTSACSTGIPLVPGVMVLLLSLLGGRYCTH